MIESTKGNRGPCSCNCADARLGTGPEKSVAEDRCAELREELRRLNRELEEFIRRNCPRRRALCVGRPEYQNLLDEIDRVTLEMQELSCPVDPPLPPEKFVRITNVEINQAIQYLNHSMNGTFQGTGVAENNSVTLIQGKATMVRLYGWTYDSATTALAGGLRWERMEGNRVIAEGWIDALAGSAAPVGSVIDRGNLTHTVNVLLPASICSGVVRVHTQIWDRARDRGRYLSEPVTKYLDFRNIGRIRVRGVLIRYTVRDANGRPTVVAPPSAAALAGSLDWTARMFPIEGLTIRATQVMDFDGDLTTEDGWNALNLRLAEMSFASSETDVFVGLLPSGVPNAGVVGRGGVFWQQSGRTARVAAFYQGGGVEGAHEIYHAFHGGGHVPCPGTNPGNAGTYPAYRTGAQGTIGEFGVDTTALQIRGPNHSDLMSYCHPRWISPVSYGALVNVLWGSPWVDRRTESVREHQIAATVEMAALSIRFDRRWAPTLESCLRIGHLIHHGQDEPESDGQVRGELLDSGGAVLASFALSAHSRETRKHPPFTLYGAVRWDRRAASLIVVRDGHELGQIDLPADDLKVSIDPLPPSTRESGMTLKWSSASSSGTLEHSASHTIRFSNDGGETWLALCTGVQGNQRQIRLEDLPGGSSCLFEVIAMQGARCGTARSQSFEMPLRRRDAFIFEPAVGTVVEHGTPVPLSGTAYSADFGSALPSDMVWHSHLDGVLGLGASLCAANLSPGRHQITLTAFDGIAGASSASVWILVRSGV